MDDSSALWRTGGLGNASNNHAVMKRSNVQAGGSRRILHSHLGSHVHLHPNGRSSWKEVSRSFHRQGQGSLQLYKSAFCATACRQRPSDCFQTHQSGLLAATMDPPRNRGLLGRRPPPSNFPASTAPQQSDNMQSIHQILQQHSLQVQQVGALPGCRLNAKQGHCHITVSRFTRLMTSVWHV